MAPNEKAAAELQLWYARVEYEHWKAQIEYCEQQRLKRATGNAPD